RGCSARPTRCGTGERSGSPDAKLPIDRHRAAANIAGAARERKEGGRGSVVEGDRGAAARKRQAKRISRISEAMAMTSPAISYWERDSRKNTTPMAVSISTMDTEYTTPMVASFRCFITKTQPNAVEA